MLDNIRKSKSFIEAIGKDFVEKTIESVGNSTNFIFEAGAILNLVNVAC